MLTQDIETEKGTIAEKNVPRDIAIKIDVNWGKLELEAQYKYKDEWQKEMLPYLREYVERHAGIDLKDLIDKFGVTINGFYNPSKEDIKILTDRDF